MTQSYAAQSYKHLCQYISSPQFLIDSKHLFYAWHRVYAAWVPPAEANAGSIAMQKAWYDTTGVVFHDRLVIPHMATLQHMLETASKPENRKRDKTRGEYAWSVSGWGVAISVMYTIDNNMPDIEMYVKPHNHFNLEGTQGMHLQPPADLNADLKTLERV